MTVVQNQDLEISTCWLPRLALDRQALLFLVLLIYCSARSRLPSVYHSGPLQLLHSTEYATKGRKQQIQDGSLREIGGSASTLSSCSATHTRMNAGKNRRRCDERVQTVNSTDCCLGSLAQAVSDCGSHAATFHG